MYMLSDWELMVAVAVDNHSMLTIKQLVSLCYFTQSNSVWSHGTISSMVNHSPMKHGYALVICRRYREWNKQLPSYPDLGSKRLHGLQVHSTKEAWHWPRSCLGVAPMYEVSMSSWWSGDSDSFSIWLDRSWKIYCMVDPYHICQ